MPTRLGRAALEILYGMGEVGVHHRINTRRYFDLIERLLPADLLAAPDPNPADEAYQDWHVTRRVGGLGIANPAASQYWLGMGGMKAEGAARDIGTAVGAGRADPGRGGGDRASAAVHPFL